MELTRKTILSTLETHRSELERLGVRRIGLFGLYRGVAGARSTRSADRGDLFSKHAP